MPRIRVLIAEDSLTVRKRLRELLENDAEMEVVAEAADGKEAIALCQELRPDVVSMDMMMPMMTGLAATEYIMAHCPTPILIVSSSMNRGELFHSYDALKAGAVDVLDKDDVERAYVSTLKLVSRIRVITHLRGRNGVEAPPPVAPSTPSARLIAIGASTGGPGAVARLLAAMDASLRVPVLAVMHISPPFAPAFSEWLEAQTGRVVRYAQHGERIGPGRCLLAPAGRHMTVEGDRLCLSDGPERHSCRPSIDVFFESMARVNASGIVACLLTGMGRDGAAGLLALRRAGASTVAQDEATSVVFGMPREAIQLGAAERVLGIGDIAALCKRLQAEPT